MFKNLSLIQVALFVILGLPTIVKAQKDQSQFLLFVGAYTQNDQEGIYVYNFDAAEGNLKYLKTEAGVANPSYLAIDAKNKRLFAVNEIGEFNGQKSGAVSAFAIQPATGDLQLINQVLSGGGSPCYISINKNGSNAFVANYSGGNVSMFPISSNGALGPYSDLQQHQGSGSVTGRQDHPHAHSSMLSPNGNMLLSADLGIDKVIAYNVDEKEGKLQKAGEFKLEPGSGPRHLAFHPNKKFVYIISELNSTISACSWDAKTGQISELMKVSTLPEGFSGKNSCADIHISPNGKNLYGSNRGHNSIAIFDIDQKTGAITPIDHRLVNGKTPRNFVIDPTGKFLLVANQDTDNIVVFKIDSETGKLKSNGVEVSVSKPVCLKFMELK